MVPRLLLRQVHLLEGPDRPARRADMLIEPDRSLRIEAEIGIGIAGSQTPPETSGARELATQEMDVQRLDAQEVDARDLWLAPALVDPHSVLEDPMQGRAETLASLAAAAAAGGYGTVALLPWGPGWRDRPERLDLHWPDPLRLLLWGSFSLEGADRELAPHGDQLAAGAIGLSGGDGLPPLDLLERGLRLGEMGDRPVLLPPRDASLARQGFVRERVEALRAGWPLDPPISETLPLQSLLTLAAALPELSLRLMNLSTADAVALLRRCRQPPPTSVCWWHLIADSGSLDPADEGWRLVPPLGAPADREALIGALGEGLIGAVAVHHLALDAEERLLPLDQRRAGLAGHGVVLPLLWAELVGRRGWSPERLWQVLCWGPARFLGMSADVLATGSRRWLLFDPAHTWTWGASTCASRAANQPRWNESIQGAVVASGLSDPKDWRVPGGPWC